MASHQFRSSWSGKGHALPVSLFLSYSLHHCGTSVIYIYFIKDKKKRRKIRLKHMALLKPVSDTRERNCSQYAFRSGTSTLPSLALLLVNLPWRLKELNDGTHRSQKLWPRTEEVVIACGQPGSTSPVAFTAGLCHWASWFCASCRVLERGHAIFISGVAFKQLVSGLVDHCTVSKWFRQTLVTLSVTVTSYQCASGFKKKKKSNPGKEL